MEHQINNEESLYKCFFKDALTKAECESYELNKNANSFRTTDKKPGIWAKSKCTSNEECPFYKNNQIIQLIFSDLNILDFLIHTIYDF